MAVIDVLELPFAQPDVVLLGNRAIFENLAYCDRPLKYVEEVPSVFLPSGEVYNAFRFNACQGHSPQPFPDLAIILASMSHSQRVDHAGGREPDRIGNDAVALSDLLQDLLKGKVFILVRRSGKTEFAYGKDCCVGLNPPAVIGAHLQ